MNLRTVGIDGILAFSLILLGIASVWNSDAAAGEIDSTSGAGALETIDQQLVELIRRAREAHGLRDDDEPQCWNQIETNTASLRALQDDLSALASEGGGFYQLPAFYVGKCISCSRDSTQFCRTAEHGLRTARQSILKASDDSKTKVPGEYFVAAPHLNVRDEPADSAKVTGQVHFKEAVNVREFRESWARISEFSESQRDGGSDSVAQWVSAQHLAKRRPSEVFESTR